MPVSVLEIFRKALIFTMIEPVQTEPEKIKDNDILFMQERIFLPYMYYTVSQPLQLP